MQGRELWHVGSFSFAPWTVVVPFLVAGVLWALASFCLRFRWARIPMMLVPIGFGGWVGIGALTAPHGYAAGYSFGGVYVLTLVTAVASLLLLPWRRTRRSGLLGLAAAAAMFTTFYAVFLVGYSLDLHAWKHKQRIEIPPTPPR